MKYHTKITPNHHQEIEIFHPRRACASVYASANKLKVHNNSRSIIMSAPSMFT